MLYEEDVKSVTKVVKACIVKLTKEWDREEEQKQTETSLQEADTVPAANGGSQMQEAQMRPPVMSNHEPSPSYHRSDSVNSTSHRSQCLGQFDPSNGRTQTLSENCVHGESQVLFLNVYLLRE